MRRRLVLLTEIIAPYRIPVFNALARDPEIDLHVIFLSETDTTLRQWHVYKQDIQFSYQVLSSWRWRVGSRQLLLNRGLPSALHQANPDAILCGGYNYLSSWHALAWARRHRTPFLLWVESTLKDQRGGRGLAEFLKKKIIKRSDIFVVPGKSAREYLASYGVPNGRIVTAPNAVDNDLFQQMAQKAREEAAKHRGNLHLPSRYFLFVGRLVREKGVFELLDAYGTLTEELRKEVGLVFAGGGAGRAELERCASHIGGTIQFAGFVHREELAAYYALAEVLVFPTHTDTWGLVVNEAMACGLPIIASDVAGCVADLVEDGWNGVVVSAGSSSQLRAAMESTARNSDLRLQMSERSSERILQYSPVACAAGIAQAVSMSGRRRG